MARRERHTERKIVRRALQDYGLRSPRAKGSPYTTLEYVPTDPEQLLWVCIGGAPGKAPDMGTLARYYYADQGSMLLVCSAIREHAGTHTRAVIPYEDGRKVLKAVSDYMNTVAHNENPKTKRRFSIPKHKDADVSLRDPTPPPTREMREAWDKETRSITRAYRGRAGVEVIVPIEHLRHEWEPRVWKTRKCARCHKCRKLGLCRHHYRVEQYIPDSGAITDLGGF